MQYIYLSKYFIFTITIDIIIDSTILFLNHRHEKFKLFNENIFLSCIEDINFIFP